MITGRSWFVSLSTASEPMPGEMKSSWIRPLMPANRKKETNIMPTKVHSPARAGSFSRQDKA
jgi:hypothetical protein